MSIPEVSSRAAPGPDSCRPPPAHAQACPCPLATPGIWVHIPPGKGEPREAQFRGLALGSGLTSWAEAGAGVTRVTERIFRAEAPSGPASLPGSGPPTAVPAPPSPPSFPGPRRPHSAPLRLRCCWIKASVLHLSPVSFRAACLFRFPRTVRRPVRSPPRPREGAAAARVTAAQAHAAETRVQNLAVSAPSPEVSVDGGVCARHAGPTSSPGPVLAGALGEEPLRRPGEPADWFLRGCPRSPTAPWALVVEPAVSGCCAEAADSPLNSPAPGLLSSDEPSQKMRTPVLPPGLRGLTGSGSRRPGALPPESGRPRPADRVSEPRLPDLRGAPGARPAGCGLTRFPAVAARPRRSTARQHVPDSRLLGSGLRAS